MRKSEIKDFINQKRKVIVAHQKRLNTLEIKAAKYGMECPASIEMEIDEIMEKVKTLEAEIESVSSTSNKSIDEVFKAYNKVIESNRTQMLEIRNMMLMKIDEYESQAGESRNIGTISPNTDLILEALKRQVKYIESIYLDDW
jgi:hypothetical protein